MQLVVTAAGHGRAAGSRFRAGLQSNASGELCRGAGWGDCVMHSIDSIKDRRALLQTKNMKKPALQTATMLVLKYYT